MKKTGFIRTCDSLGRIVIPMEIRRWLHIKEGEPLELALDQDAEQIIIDEAAFLPQAEREVYYLMDEDVTGVEFFHCAVNIDWVYADITE